jgi:LytR cell envelope-related transcriptional attenuator
VVVIVVIVLLIIINGHGTGGSSQAAVTSPPPASSPQAAPSSPSPSPRPTRSRTSASPSTPAAPTSPTPKKTQAAAPSAKAPVQVLNNSRRTGLAHQVAAVVGDEGWHIYNVGNLQGLVPVSTVYYPPGDRAAARHLMHDFSSIRRIAPNGEGRINGSGLTLVVTADWVL